MSETPFPRDDLLPGPVLELANAGRRMTEVLEEDVIEACGNSPPPCTGCEMCNPARTAIRRWAGAVVRVRHYYESGEARKALESTIARDAFESIQGHLARLGQMSIAELRREHKQVFGISTTSRNKQMLRKKLAYRLQKLAESTR